MNLSEVFELIRKEPVCLFIGSGFSFYAGMPSAGKLISILIDSLSVSQRNKINVNQDLRKFTEDFQALFGRNKLINVLQEVIDIDAPNSHLHDYLAKIPYFNSIITTNYDRLIENSFGENAAVAINSSNIFNPKRPKTRVFKIHGDIRDGKSIVITTSDYSKQYNRIFKDPFWASIIAEISSKHIIFLGYGYEDENVWADFDYVEEKLKGKNKKRIFISPFISSLKKKRLKRSNISYVEADGETFLNGFIANLKSNIIEDHRKGFVDTQTAQEFITAFDLKVDIHATKDVVQLMNISRLDGPTEHKFEFTTSNQELLKLYQEFNKGYELKDLKILSDQLNSFALHIEDFTFLNKDSLAHIKVSHTPKFDGICKVKFPESGFTLSKIHCRLFNSIPGKALIELDVAGFRATFKLEIVGNYVKMDFKVDEPEITPPINKAYEVLRAFYLLFSGEIVEIYPKGGKLIKHRLSKQEKGHIEEFKSKMNFYYALKRIEKTFNLKFPPVALWQITEEDTMKVQKIHNLIEYGYHIVREDGGLVFLDMPPSRLLFEKLQSDVLSKGYISIQTKSGREIELYGKVLHLGEEQVSIKQPTITNLDFDSLSMKLNSIDNIFIYHYKKFGHWEIPNSTSLWNNEE